MTASGRAPDTLRHQLDRALGGTYRIEREIGGGGMSRVFLAEETALGRTVVVKVLSAELTHELSAERFTREIRLSARLQHPNIVPVLTAGTASGMPYYTMPFIDGESLRARLRRLAPGELLPLPHVIHLLRDVARALAYAHSLAVFTGTSSRRTCSSVTTRRSSPILVWRGPSSRRAPRAPHR
jgi:serine/threonine-protein kinase